MSEEKNVVTEWLTSQIFDTKKRIAEYESNIMYVNAQLKVARGELWDLEQAAIKLVFYKDLKNE